MVARNGIRHLFDNSFEFTLGIDLRRSRIICEWTLRSDFFTQESKNDLISSSFSSEQRAPGFVPEES